MMNALLDIARGDDHQTETVKSKPVNPVNVDNGDQYSKFEKKLYIWINKCNSHIQQITNKWHLKHQDKVLVNLLKGKFN